MPLSNCRYLCLTSGSLSAISLVLYLRLSISSLVSFPLCISAGIALILSVNHLTHPAPLYSSPSFAASQRFVKGLG